MRDTPSSPIKQSLVIGSPERVECRERTTATAANPAQAHAPMALIVNAAGYHNVVTFFLAHPFVSPILARRLDAQTASNLSLATFATRDPSTIDATSTRIISDKGKNYTSKLCPKKMCV